MNKATNLSEIDLRVSLLKEVIIFTHIDDETIREIANALDLVHLTDGQVLFSKGDDSHSMYIVNEGSVKVHDKDYVFTTLNHGSVFGEYAFLDEMARSASVTGVGKSSVFQLKKVDFDAIIKKKPKIKDGILEMLLLRLRERNDWEERLAIRNKEIEKQKEEIENKNKILTKLNDEIRAQKELKDRFFAIISHDLRGPVSSFHGMSDVIDLYIKKKRYDDLEKMIPEIAQATSQLSGLLDNLLNWASQELSQIPYEPIQIDVSEMVEDLFQVLQSTAISKDITFSNKVKKETRIWADLNSTRTIFRNLISNALKFTENEGVITISNNQAEDLMEIHVQDTGVGIPEEKLADLFVLSEQSSTYGTKGEKGVGLGLQLVSDFSKLNKGALRVESTVGKGTTFTVSLPVSSNVSN
jgi:signal transduction histidine kinase